MKRYFVPLLAGLIMLAAPLAAQQTESMRVNADRVNLRKAPSIDSGIVRSLSKGTVVTIVARDGNWTRVQLPGQPTTGWVRSDLLVAAPAAPAASQGIKPASPPPPAPAAKHESSTPPPLPPAPRSTPPKPAPPPNDRASGSADASYHGGFTVFGGMTMFNYNVTPAGSFTGVNASGFAAGLGLIAHLGGPVGLEVDAQYVQKGYADNTGSVKASRHDNFAGGALLLRPAFGSGRVRVFLLGGAEAGYEINCAKSSGATCTIEGTMESRTDYGALVGGGVSFGPVAAQLRYDLGLANLNKVAGVTVKTKGLLILGSLIL
jgi:hypothetical protein